jgi:hypothetical protein
MCRLSAVALMVKLQLSASALKESVVRIAATVCMPGRSIFCQKSKHLVDGCTGSG